MSQKRLSNIKQEATNVEGQFTIHYLQLTFFSSLVLALFCES